MNNNEMKNLKETLVAGIKDWFERTNGKVAVIGISGGKDSTCVAALCVEALGVENVIGVSMPNGVQSDMDDVNRVFDLLKIKRVDINIHDAFESILKQMNDIKDNTIINLPPRLRMSTLFAVAQSCDKEARVMNTCNLSEDMVGYATIFGDACGLYAPLSKVTCTEVKELAHYMGVNKELAFKTPSDGLCGQTDEDKLGFTYEALDNFIRKNEGTEEFKEMIMNKYKANKFKLDLIQIPHPEVKLPNYITKENV